MRLAAEFSTSRTLPFPSACVRRRCASTVPQFLGLAAVALLASGCQTTSTANREAPENSARSRGAVVVETSTPNDSPAFVSRGKLDEQTAVQRTSGPYIAGDAHIQPATVTASSSPAPPSAAESSVQPNVDPARDGSPPPPSGLEGVKVVLERAERFQEKYPDYVLRLTRIERVRSTMRSPEVILMKIRSRPRGVYLKWLDEANDGRECIWVAGQNNGKMISRGGRGDLLLAGKTLWLDPDGTLARSKSSQPITESGLDVILGKIRARVVRLERGDESLGRLAASREPDPAEPARVYDWILHEAPPRVDADLPDGGVHRYGFRTDNGRVEVVHAYDDQGQLVYTFRFDRFIPVADLSPADFDPEVVWPRRQTGREPSQHEKMVLSNDQPAF